MSNKLDDMRRITRQIDETFQEAARLSGMSLPPTDFYQQFLEKAIAGIDAKAGAVWVRTPQGFLQLQCQINLDQIGLDHNKGARQHHNELLRFAFQNRKELLAEPQARIQLGERQIVENRTEYLVILAPIKVEDGSAVGLVEVCTPVAWDPQVHPTYLNYVVQMAGYASNYVMQTQARQSTNQEQVWTQLESFARSVHSSLDPKEVAYTIANDGRKLIGCDRLSVAVRHGKKAKVEAVSGADIVEKASTHVRMMRRLFDSVIQWGEKLVYKGERDETLPPDVLDALDDHLAESNPKLLVVLPLRDEREKEKEAKGEKVKPPRSALLLESYEPPAHVEPIISRLDVVGGHAAGALYNAAEMKRVPFRWIWFPFAKLQDGLGGKTKFWLTFSAVLLIGLLGALFFVPSTLELESDGELLTDERSLVYTPRPGKVVRFRVDHGDSVRPGQSLIEMFDPELRARLDEVTGKIRGTVAQITNLEEQKKKAERGQNTNEIETQLAQARNDLKTSRAELGRLIEIYNADPQRPGVFYIDAPEFGPGVIRKWTVLSADFKKELTGRNVQPGDPMLRLGNVNGKWEIKLKIPQKHIGQVRKAMEEAKKNEQDFLRVDVLVTSAPTKMYVGRLYARDIGGEAIPNRDDQGESEPVVEAFVTVNTPEIPKEFHVPERLLISGVEVNTQIHCGKHSLGYTLFYGVWEFLYRNVVFYL